MRRVISVAGAACVLMAIAAVTAGPIDWRPGDILGVDADRALAFALLGGLSTCAYPRRWRIIALGMAAVSFGLELTQLLSESRHARIEDAAIKLFGALAGIGLALLARHAWLKIGARRDGRVAVPPAPQIAAIFFDPADGLLRLRFANGEERLFAGVGQGAVTGLMQAPEPGRYYLDHIDDRYERRAA